MGAEDFFAAEDFIVECTTSVVAKFNAPVSILAITVSLLCPVSLAIVSRIVVQPISLLFWVGIPTFQALS